MGLYNQIVGKMYYLKKLTLLQDTGFPGTRMAQTSFTKRRLMRKS